MPQRLLTLAQHEHCRVQTIYAPAEGSIPDHVVVFIEARDPETVQREIERLGRARGVLEAVFVEPLETPRETFSSYGYLTDHPSASQRRNSSRRGLPSSLA